jgi:hypothetical protein
MHQPITIGLDLAKSVFQVNGALLQKGGYGFECPCPHLCQSPLRLP